MGHYRKENFVLWQIIFEKRDTPTMLKVLKIKEFINVFNKVEKLYLTCEVWQEDDERIWRNQDRLFETAEQIKEDNNRFKNHLSMY